MTLTKKSKITSHKSGNIPRARISSIKNILTGDPDLVSFTTFKMGVDLGEGFEKVLRRSGKNLSTINESMIKISVLKGIESGIAAFRFKGKTVMAAGAFSTFSSLQKEAPTATDIADKLALIEYMQR